MTTNFTANIDLAQVILYLFLGFFLALVYYLHRENKREGYPLESDRSGAVTVQGFPAVPKPKTYLLADGSTVHAPRAQPHDARPVNATPAANFPGAPLVPNGDPMTVLALVRMLSVATFQILPFMAHQSLCRCGPHLIFMSIQKIQIQSA
jgi:Photosynthetic reaction centre, H-chain N-terminal region